MAGISNPQVSLAVAGTCTLGPGASTTTASYHAGMVNIIGGGTRALLRIENNNSVGSPGIIFGEGGGFTEDTQPTIKKVQGTNNLAIMCGGKVGIGTTSPGSQLTMYSGTSNNAIDITGTTQVGLTGRFTAGGYLSFVITDASHPDGYSWRFQDDTALLNGSLYFRVKYTSGDTYVSGNLGVGVLSPGYKIDADVNANVDGGAQMKNSSTGTAAVSAWRLGNANGGNRGGIALLGSGFTTSGMYRQDGVYCYSASSGGFTLSAQGVNNIYFHTNSTERMRIDSSGNVGITTVAPNCPLDLGTNVQNKIIGLWNPNNSGANSTDFYGFGINSGTLRYQVYSSNDVHKFYGGSTLYATIGTQVQVPGKYYAAGYLGGGTAAGNFINLYTVQTQGGMAVTSSNKLVAPIAGLYHFGFQTIMQTSTGRNDVWIYLNGSVIFCTLNEDNGSGYHYRSQTMCYYLNANDYIQFYCYSGTLYGVSAADDYKWRSWYFYHVG